LKLRDLFKRKGCVYCTELSDGNEDGLRVVLPPDDMNGEDFNDLVVSRFHIDIPSKTLCYYGEDRQGMGADDYITIKYCPKCGRKL